MSKILKNSTMSPISISDLGISIPANSSYTVQTQDYSLLSSTDVISELTPLITNGNIIVNDGVYDLSISEAINFIKYPDTAFNIRFLSEPERSNGREAKNAQEAIEEALATALTNDRYSFTAQYGGNAGVGRYLEIFPAIDSLTAPFIFPEDSTIITVTMGTDNSSGVFTLGFFVESDLINPAFTVTLNDGIDAAVFNDLSFAFLELNKLSLRITSGSRVKPYVRVWVNTIGI